LSIATQLKVIREQQGMTQAELAERIGTKQGGVSRLESADYAGWSIAILRRVAKAFDLRLRVSFEEFGALWEEVGNFNRQSLERRNFNSDPEFTSERQPDTRPQQGESLLTVMQRMQRVLEGAGQRPKIGNLIGELKVNPAIFSSLSALSELAARFAEKQKTLQQELQRATMSFGEVYKNMAALPQLKGFAAPVSALEQPQKMEGSEMQEFAERLSSSGKVLPFRKPTAGHRNAPYGRRSHRRSSQVKKSSVG
jgi:transcriptional regulator with XRE-family HTH domain